jgi:hypothetical protein
MQVLRVRNVHIALPLGLRLLAECGLPMPSRNGPVLVAPGPVTTVYDAPCERVLFWPERDANPFFHFFEALWMLAGRNDVAFLTYFVKRFEQYSDDGVTVAGAYGDRWRNHFPPGDQLMGAVELLKRDPWSRQAVIAMWDPFSDGPHVHTADRPCNTHLYLSASYGKTNETNRLNMTLCCRSNDIIWGAYGANAVHFSFLLEYLAAHIGLVPGTLYQVSSNFHAYDEVYRKIRCGDLLVAEPTADPYTAGAVAPFPLIVNPVIWDQELSAFLENPAGKFTEPFFETVAKPMWWAHVSFKKYAFSNALEIINECQATDWRRAAVEWLQRRRLKWQAKRREELAAL